jgi:hypothetical protein
MFVEFSRAIYNYFNLSSQWICARFGRGRYILFKSFLRRQ